MLEVGQHMKCHDNTLKEDTTPEGNTIINFKQGSPRHIHDP
jgi:hypothetical protein